MFMTYQVVLFSHFQINNLQNHQTITGFTSYLTSLDQILVRDSGSTMMVN